MDDTPDGSHADDARVDVVQYASGVVKAVPAGKGAAIVRSQNRGRPASLLRDRVVVGAGAVAAAVTGLFFVVALAYSLLVLRAVLLGLLAAAAVAAVAALGVAGVAAARWATGGDATLLDESVALRDAREQWGAEPVSAVAQSDERHESGQRNEREHAYE